MKKVNEKKKDKFNEERERTCQADKQTNMGGNKERDRQEKYEMETVRDRGSAKLCYIGKLF